MKPPTAGLLHDLFALAAARFPDRIALDVPPLGGKTRRLLTYRELRDQASSLAAAVASYAAPDAVIALFLPRHDLHLYAAQLGVWQAGAAFTCLDPAFPDLHLATVLRDAVAVVTDAAGCARLAAAARAADVPLPPMLEVASVGAAAGPALPVLPSHLAYVIYTSGTTGQPKGVMIEHGAIANLAWSNVSYFRLSPKDRVAQCSSPAYDSSIEETWLAFAVGATLVLLDDQTLRLGPDLIAWLRRERITAWSPPPTLLRSTGCNDPRHALPELRLVYVGGEALPQDLADRWAPGRWLENGYGPTECSVTSVRGRMRAGRAVTIGRPVAGCQAWVMDPDLRLTAPGEPGELCLSGRCLARGYLRDEAMTLARFPTHPALGRLYRTGDRVRQRDDGAFEFLGRLDGQVKVRGYRVELEAVEAALAACPGVRTAGCRVQNGVLTAHVVPEDLVDAPPDPEALKLNLRARLPGYMVPARWGVLPDLPTTAGGKLDRARLPELAATRTSERPDLPPRTPAEQAVAAAIAAVLGCGAISVDDDFFLDLGGDSVAAVAVVVRLRDGGWEASARDLYEARTASAWAARLVSSAAAAPLPPTAPPARTLLFTAAQCAWLALEWTLAGAAFYAAGFLLLPWLLDRYALPTALLALLGLTGAAGVGLAVLAVAAAVALKRMLIGTYRTQRIPLWSGLHLRHWIVVHMARHISWELFQGTALQCAVLRALGARIGTRVYIHRGVDLARGGWDLLEIGDGATLGQEAGVRMVTLAFGAFTVGTVTIGAGCTLDTRASLDAGARMEPGSELGPLGWLPANAHVPSGERWAGVPATRAGVVVPPPLRDSVNGPGLPPRLHAAVVVSARAAMTLAPWLLWLVLVEFAPPASASRLLAWLNAPTWSLAGVAATGFLAAAAILAGASLQALAARRLGRLPAGPVSLWSTTAIRLNAAAALLESAGRWLAGSLAWPVWLRAAGMRVGRDCEISTLLDVVPAAIAIADHCFFADGIYLAGPRRAAGVLTLRPTSLGRHTFLGNHAVIPAGSAWPERMFVGVATVPDPRQVRPNTAWFGSPPLELPRRPAVTDPRLTHRPSPLRYATRLSWELARLVVPLPPLLLAGAWATALDAIAGALTPPVLVFVAAPALAVAIALALLLAVVLLKWTLLGRMRPGQHAFWSCWCGRWDLLFVAWEIWGRGILTQIEGTLLLNQFLRLTGARIGRRVALGPGFLQLTEPDMLVLGDDAAVSCHLQSHTFEDRLLKMDSIMIDAAATVADDALLLYGAHIGARARVDSHSVVMKYEQVAPGAVVAGAPARPAARGQEVGEVEQTGENPCPPCSWISQ